MEENKEVTIEIPELVVNYIQRLDTECQSYRNIISYILTHDDMDITTERFNQYQNEYINRLYVFEVAKNELEKKYIQPKTSTYIKWELNYRDNLLHILQKEEI